MRNMINAVVISAFAATLAWAHCDTLDGPVVNAARRALASDDVRLVLPWIQPEQETAIRQAFTRTMQVRKLNPAARDLADTWFFETVVRIHRAGEGAPYEGLKPAGTGGGPAVSAADKAIETGKLADLERMLTTGMQEQLRHRFHRILESRNYKPDDVQAGREYVSAYVDFIHFAERVHQALGDDAGHGADHH